MKNLFLSLAGVSLFIIIAGLLIKAYYKNTADSNYNPFEGARKKVIYIGSLRLYVEIANTDELRKKGLSVRSAINDDEGMLFLFDQKDIMPAIWMKNMEFPIDIIWIKNGKIVQIHKNVPKPTKGTPDSKLKIYTPKAPVDYVLEVRGGYTDKNVVLEGAAIDLTKAL